MEGNIKQFFLLIFSIIIFAEDWINYYVNHNCNSNKTLLSIDNGQISFNALAKKELLFQRALDTGHVMWPFIMVVWLNA